VNASELDLYLDYVFLSQLCFRVEPWRWYVERWVHL